MQDYVRKRFSSIIIVFYTFLSLGAIIQKDVFAYYDQYSIYILMVLTAFNYFTNPIIKKADLGFVIIFTIYLAIALNISDGGIGSVFTFLIPVLMLFSYRNALFSLPQEKIIKCACSLILVFLLFESIIYHSDWYYYRFNAINPNTMGMYSAFALMTWFSLTEVKKANRVKMLTLSAISITAMFFYESRATMAITILYILVILLFDRFIQKKEVMILSLCTIAVGVSIPFLYLALYHNGVEFEFLGKSLYTGRELIWTSMIAKLNNSTAWLFGLGSKVTYWNETVTNVHNNYFAAIIDFGVIGFILYFGLLLRNLIKISHYEDTRIRKLVLQFVFFCLVLGFTEVTTFYSTIYPLSLLGIGWALSIDSELERNRELERSMYG